VLKKKREKEGLWDAVQVFILLNTGGAEPDLG
jgi:hypothetical protein